MERGLSADDERMAMRIADLFLLQAPDRIALIMAEALRLAIERAVARDHRTGTECTPTQKSST